MNSSDNDKSAQEPKQLSKRELEKAVNGYIAEKGWEKTLDYNQVVSLREWVIYMFQHPERQDLNFDAFAKPEFDYRQIDILCRGHVSGIDMIPYIRQGFSDRQLDVILWGQEGNLDISLYADKKFDCFQMLVIYNGLKQGLDVSLYAKPEYNEAQMSNIKYGLEKGLDVSKICNPALSAKEMGNILLSVEKRQKETVKNQSVVKKSEFNYEKRIR